jgi:hypothetical protein
VIRLAEAAARVFLLARVLSALRRLAALALDAGVTAADLEAAIGDDEAGGSNSQRDRDDEASGR